MLKWQFQIFDKAPKILQVTQINIAYAEINLYNFIKSCLENEKDIYYILNNILNDANSHNGVFII